MPLSPSLRLVIAALGGAGLCSAAAAQSPPIKPGLWQAQSTREVDGKPAIDMTARMKDMPPEARKRMEEVMREKGIDVSGDGIKMCLSRESLDQGTWQGLQAGCKTDFSTRSASAWKWHSSCTQPPAESDGEATFSSPESYTVRSSTTMTLQGKAQVSKMTVAAKWLGADCGTLKPLAPQTLKAPPKKAP